MPLFYVDMYVDEYNIQYKKRDPISKITPKIKEALIDEFLGYLKRPRFGSKGHEGESREMFNRRLVRWENAISFNTKIKVSTKPRPGDVKPRVRPVKLRPMIRSGFVVIMGKRRLIYRDQRGRFARKP